MTTEAQIQANRLNAEKSTGPRTPEGKEKASQNSLKHGLFAREGVIRGEDWEEYEMHREALLAQLDPATPLEVILATRVVDLSWRLQRAGQNQNEVFGALYDRYVARQAAGPGGADVPPSNPGPEALTTRGQSLPPPRLGDAHDTITAAERGRLLGRMILEDFENEAVLERLQRYERRIESSFYRTLNELRRVHDQSRKAAQEVAGTLERWRQEDGEARKRRALACDWRGAGSPVPAGGTTNTPGPEVAYPPEIPAAPFTHPVPDVPEDETCKTNPISQCEVSSLKLQVSDQNEDMPSIPTSNFKLHTSNVPPNVPVGGIACKTNPISGGVSSQKGPAR